MNIKFQTAVLELLPEGVADKIGVILGRQKEEESETAEDVELEDLTNR